MGLIPTATEVPDAGNDPCESDKVKSQIVNVLASAPSKGVYVVGLGGWKPSVNNDAECGNATTPVYFRALLSQSDTKGGLLLEM